MKRKSLFAALIPVLILILSSCGKNQDKAANVTTDSLNTTLPKQIIVTQTYDSLGFGTSTVTHNYVISIKYDTANQHIQLYLNDTTNTNPYDVLAATYTFNQAGYLILFTQNNVDYGSSLLMNGQVTINRNPDNTINNIVNTQPGFDGEDSTLYSYQSVNGGTSISTITHSYESQVLTDSYTVDYIFDTENKLTKVIDQDLGTLNFSYNSNNSLNTFSLQEANLTLNGNYFYASSLPDGKADTFLQTLLGKDFFLFDIKMLDPFILTAVNADFGYITSSITDPHHVTSATAQGNIYNTPFSTSATWMYQTGNQNRVTKITFAEDNSTFIYKLTY